MMKNTKGITLVALVVTIIILLILAGVAIVTLTQTGLFEKAKQAKNATENAQNSENDIIASYSDKINEITGSTREGSSTNIEIFVDGKQTDRFPGKDDNYKIDKIVCTNDARAEFDRNNWALNIYNITTDKVSCKIYFIKNQFLLDLKNNIENDNQLNTMFSTKDTFTNLANDTDCMEYICNSEKLRNIMYNNYTTTQSILSASTIAIDAMKNSANYTSINKTSFTRNDNGNVQDVIYNGKAFIIEVTCKKTSYNSAFGVFTDGSSPEHVWYYDEQDNHIARPNKFISQLKACKIWTSADPNVTYCFFKI